MACAVEPDSTGDVDEPVIIIPLRETQEPHVRGKTSNKSKLGLARVLS